jgi:hypothetical protein
VNDALAITLPRALLEVDRAYVEEELVDSKIIVCNDWHDMYRVWRGYDTGVDLVS